MEKNHDLSSVSGSQVFENPLEHPHCSEDKKNDWFLKKREHANKGKESGAVTRGPIISFHLFSGLDICLLVCFCFCFFSEKQQSGILELTL